MKEIFRVIIAGGRDYNNPDYLFDFCDIVLAHRMKDFEVVVLCGMCEGADLMGKAWAESRGLHVEEYPAYFHIQGNAAGPIRNSEMVKVADAAIFFWDGKSRGTHDCLVKAKRKGIRVRLRHYETVDGDTLIINALNNTID